jgi:nucleoside-diphosphate-sugar epimerase
MNKVLITGGAGFIGYHLAKRLLKGDYQIDLVDNLSRGSMDEEIKKILSNSKVRFFNIDLLQSSAFEKFDNDYNYIYHFAAIIGVSNILNKPYNVLKDNVLMLLNTISFAKRQSALKRFVFTSTSEVYAGTLQYFTLPIPTPESTPLALTDLSHPRTSYMLSKIYGEALCHHSALPFTIIRPHNIYGPRMGMAHVIPELLKKAYYAKEGSKLDVFSVNHRRTFCYIDDCIEMIKLSAELRTCNRQTLNVGNQSPEISIERLANLIIKSVGKDLKINPQPETPGSPSRRCPDMTKTFKLTGYKPKIEIEEGIKLTYEWYKKHYFKK